MTALLLGCGGLGTVSPGESKFRPQVAITMDDFNWNKSVKLSPDERNQAILGALRSHGNLKAALFVACKFADNDKGNELLKQWDDAGHLIGNHSYSHKYLNSKNTSADVFTADIEKCDTVIKNYRHFEKRFRFPYLKEGETAVKRDTVRTFIKQRGYRIGHVTIDASDWAVEDRLSARLTKDPKCRHARPYRDFYLEHMWERSLYYDDLARKVLGRPGEARSFSPLQFAQRIVPRCLVGHVSEQGLETD